MSYTRPERALTVGIRPASTFFSTAAIRERAERRTHERFRWRRLRMQLVQLFRAPMRRLERWALSHQGGVS